MTKAAQPLPAVKLHSSFAGAKFRPMTWHKLTADGSKLMGFGIEFKAENSRRYTPTAVNGELAPFPTKKDAHTWCKAATELAESMRQPAQATEPGCT